MLVSFVFTLPVFAEETTFVNQASSSSFLGSTAADRVNLRAGPRLTSEVILQLRKGTQVHVLSQKDSWYGILLPPEASVFIAKAFVRSDNNHSWVEGRRVHVRGGPGQAFSSLGFLSDQETIQVRKIIGEWAEIQPPSSCLGWVNKTYITFLEPEEQERSDGHH